MPVTTLFRIYVHIVVISYWHVSVFRKALQLDQSHRYSLFYVNVRHQFSHVVAADPRIYGEHMTSMKREPILAVWGLCP